MKKFVIEFLKRGALFCGLGPVILAIVYIFLLNAGVVESVAVSKMIVEILSSTIMAFIAAGVSAVYTVEKLAYPIAGLIQGSVLLLDYLGVYLMNGWLKPDLTVIIMFISIFTVGFCAIWLIIYLSVKKQIERMNMQIKAE